MQIKCFSIDKKNIFVTAHEAHVLKELTDPLTVLSTGLKPHRNATAQTHSAESSVIH